MKLADQIKKLRKDLKMTQEAFARELNLHPKQLAKYETAKVVPSVDVIARIANFCEVPTDLLIFGQDNALNKKAKINDAELLEFFRQVNQFKKPKREKIKWALKALINEDS